ncbi:zinc-binding dehydrogenase [Pseudonocardia sp. MH-G8]|uniref:zinc-binding dehydrogenase n=1 Tax=Pseudonocardia sp. MH-G8 TaxID=1854588 RepID=UPI000BA0B6C2|nr:zinc-binding dehydrogenase [Pseudonocardia sp. MH-G8]OZM75453.1 alcohol dehydrogenase [Pseudonocardia sp. MH-G8]
MSRPSAIVLHEFGTDLELRTFPQAMPEPGAVLADVTHAGVCGTDMHLQQGRLAIPLPIVLGHEAVGRVRALGAGVRTDATGAPLCVGDLVSWASNIPCGACTACGADGAPSLCETRRVYGINQGCAQPPHLSGGWSEQIYLQPGSTIVRVPDGVGPEEVIALGCAGPTVTHALRDVAQVREGDVVVVQGSGPVGMAAAMLAAVAGARRVVVVGGPANRLETARRIGVGDVHIDIGAETDPRGRLARVLAETADGRGADLVIEATGVPSAVAEGIDMARRGGTYLVVGQYTDHGETPINPHHITRKQLRVLGSWAFSPQNHVDYVLSVPALAARFDLPALLTAYPLERANDALADMRAGRTLKPVLVNGART